MRTADVVVIGAGFAGAATAYHLARRGVRNVVVVEREAVPGLHASGRNAALAFTVLSDPDEARLATEGAAFIAAPPHGFTDAPLFQPNGSLLVASAAPGMESLANSARMAERLGLACSLISPAEAVARVPVLADAPLLGALWNPHDGVVDIHALLQGYLAGARASGATIDFHTEVTGFVTNAGRITGVETSRGRIDTACVVNAAGGWAGVIGSLAHVGSRGFQPRRRHLFVTLIDDGIDHGWPFVWHNDFDTYFRPEGEGLLMSPCDATPHPAQEPVVDDAAKVLLAEKLAAAFPRLAQARVSSGWACLRTFAPDERFVIGRDPDLTGLVWVGALGGHGMTTSYAVGRLGAAAVLADDDAQLRAFRVDRFA